MIIEESTIVTQAVFNDNRTHRTLLKKTFGDGQSAAILMTNPSTADAHKMDATTTICINQLSTLGFQSISIINAFSLMTKKLDLKGNLDELNIKENFEQIVETADECDVIIISVGSLVKNYKSVAAHMYKLYDMLRPYQDKIKTIVALDGTKNMHALSVKARTSEWRLEVFTLPSSPLDVQTEHASPRGNDMQDDSTGNAPCVLAGVGETSQTNNSKRSKRK